MTVEVLKMQLNFEKKDTVQLSDIKTKEGELRK